MPAPATVPALLELLQQSHLLGDQIYAQVLQQLPTITEIGDDPARLAKALIKSKLLTMYQATRLLEGRVDGFYVGKYKLLEVLGQGGMGVVFLAENTTMKRLVALKVIAREGEEGEHIAARFRREARAVATLSHPNIVQAYDFDEIEGIPFISMEYVEGMDLDRMLRKKGKLPFGQAADIIRQAALGLDHARTAKLVHRDIKPANLLVTPDGGVKLLDLGLAANTHDRKKDSLTGRMDQVGTVDYMAPEQALDSRNVDTRADIYSLGCVFYFILTQKLPCDGNSPAEKLLKHQSIDPVPIQELIPKVPEALAAIVHKMMAKRPENRHQTPAEIANELKPFSQAVIPPYDLSDVRHPKEALQAVMGRAPAPSQINVREQLSGVCRGFRASESSLPSTLAVAVQSVVAPKPTTALAIAKPAGELAPVPAPSPAKAPTTKPAPNAVEVVGKVKRSALSQVATRDADDSWIEEALPMARPKKKTGKKAEKNSGFPVALLLAGGAAAVVVIVLLVVFLRPSGTTTDSVVTNLGTTPAETPPAAALTPPPTVTSTAQFVPLDLKTVANTVTTKGMFNGVDLEIERLVFPDWTPKSVDNIPFQLIDPQGDQTPNAILMYSATGKLTKEKPKSVTIPVRSAAKALHFLGGVSGWAYPVNPEKTVSQIVRINYADGQFEEHELKNGEVFADYIRVIDVPKSKLAFKLREQQIRYFSIEVNHPETIASIELRKGSDSTSPITMAITVQRP